MDRAVRNASAYRKYNTFDPQSRELLKQALEEAGSAPYLVIPKEADIETKR